MTLCTRTQVQSPSRIQSRRSSTLAPPTGRRLVWFFAFCIPVFAARNRSASSRADRRLLARFAARPPKAYAPTRTASAASRVNPQDFRREIKVSPPVDAGPVSKRPPRRPPQEEPRKPPAAPPRMLGGPRSFGVLWQPQGVPPRGFPRRTHQPP